MKPLEKCQETNWLFLAAKEILQSEKIKMLYDQNRLYERHWTSKAIKNS